MVVLVGGVALLQIRSIASHTDDLSIVQRANVNQGEVDGANHAIQYDALALSTVSATSATTWPPTSANAAAS